ncbi:carbohydrate esterase family 16 protein [Neolentinus lepideus HHB14362 ss-1]|uniref:Carbohydrate esterase family 16 protein n=1 Tax=Neolentinus lepideus HHB14362 ss-1 TaxID=1314782 RepID=A0A165RL72_9AGAM|nr:carbohydrate esterase family 16 protein [Neolentinus lepideus HHB14362 ss-1]
MRLPSGLVSATLLFTASAAVAQQLTWGTTKYFFVFGDSYTTDGYNVSAGINSPDPGYTSSNGPNWVEFLTNTYNVTNTKTYDLAYGGATIDSALVQPYLPTVLSIVDQVSQFNEYLASKPAEAPWTSADSLFAVWIGINDVGNSWSWTNVSQPAFYTVLMNRLFGQVESLYDAGARSFLFLTVPPTNRAPLFLEQGVNTTIAVQSAIADYNAQLTSYVRQFQASHADLGQVTVFDTQPVFNTLLDAAETFGFVNSTGYCAAYANGTPGRTTQVEGCAPVSTYFWLNTLHPVFTVHDILAKAISSALSTNTYTGIAY